MLRESKRFIRNRIFRKGNPEISPDEIFLDSSNLPNFDNDQFEGRLERPISRFVLNFLFLFFIFASIVLCSRAWVLQVKEGEAYFQRSENNRLRYSHVFSNRGVVYDRNGKELITNISRNSDEEFSRRSYPKSPGFSHLLGYVKYPTKDKHGFYWETSFVGKDGVEMSFSDYLLGENGLQIVETDAFDRVTSQTITKQPKDGQNISLSVDSELQKKFFEIVSETAGSFGFQGGAGAIMDVRTGEILSLVSFPEYESNILSQGENQEAISSYIQNSGNPFLNRVISGLYVPGSIVKPFITVAALNEGIINPSKQIMSTGRMVVPNPYFPELSSVFTDWKAHGLVDMVDALAFSSNIYFYHIGGGFGDQKGLGISKLEKYFSDFGLAQKTNINLPNESVGVIPNPEWKKKNFDGDDWRIGDTYNSSIGQYGFQVTPIQVLRAVVALANGGTLLEPKLLKNGEGNLDPKVLNIKKDAFEITKEGMRQAVLKGTAGNLNVSYTEVAAKTGTAEIGKAYLNSWVTGFFPYKNPKYAFVVIMERGPRDNSIGGVYVMRRLLDWMSQNVPEYLN